MIFLKVDIKVCDIIYVVCVSFFSNFCFEVNESEGLVGLYLNEYL